MSQASNPNRPPTTYIRSAQHRKLIAPGRSTIVIFAAFAVLQSAAVVIAASAALLVTVGNVALSCTTLAIINLHRIDRERRPHSLAAGHQQARIRMKDDGTHRDGGPPSSSPTDPLRDRAIAAVVRFGRRPPHRAEILALPPASVAEQRPVERLPEAA